MKLDTIIIIFAEEKAKKTVYIEVVNLIVLLCLIIHSLVGYFKIAVFKLKNYVYAFYM